MRLSLLDMGNHVIADDNLGVVEWYSDVPKIFAGKNLISADLCEKWIRMIGFRNALVHEHIDIDRRVVFDILQNGLKDIEQLEVVFAGFL